jgi:hypothetical protein
MRGRQYEAVGQLTIVQNRAAARLATDHAAAGAGRVLLALIDSLEVTERERWLTPLVNSQCGDAVFSGVDQQGLVDGHVPGAGGGRVDDHSAGRFQTLD